MNREKWVAYLDKAVFVLLCAFALGGVVSDMWVRNCIRILLPLAGLRILLQPSILRKCLELRGFFIAFLVWAVIVVLNAYFVGVPATLYERYTYSMSYSVLLIPAIVCCVHSRRQLQTLIACAALSVLAMDFYLIYQYIHGNVRPVTWGGQHPLITACFFVTLLPVFLYQALEAQGKRLRYAYGALSLLSLVSFFLTNTRGAWIALAPVLVVIIWTAIRSLRTRLAILGGVLLLGIALMLAIPSLGSRVATVGDSHENSQYTRFLYYQSSLHMFEDYPLTGVGIGNWGRAYVGVYHLPQAPDLETRHSHSNYLHILAEMGITGFAAFIAACGFLLAFAWKRRHTVYGRMLVASAVGMYLYGLTDYTVASATAMRLFWFTAGITMAGALLAEKEKSPGLE